MKAGISTVFLILWLISMPALSAAVEVAPRITDREVVESLADIRGDIKRLEDGQKALDKRIDDLRAEMNSRFDELRWMLGIFISISLVILGFVLRMQWQMNKRLAHVETSLETQKDEISFLKELIEKLLPPKGVL